MKKLTVYMKELKGVKYHISYDAKNCDKDFGGNHDKAREYMLTTLKELGAISVESYCETTIIANFSVQKTNTIFSTFKDSVSPMFYYSISKIAKTTTEDKKPIIVNKGDSELNKNIQDIFKKILIQKK